MSPTERLTMPVAVHMFLFKDDKVLLLRRFNTGFEDGNFSVPAGHLDGNETIAEAASRELREELGVQSSIEQLKIAGVMHRKAASERIDFFVLVKEWADEPMNCEPDKCDCIEWHPFSDLPCNMVPYVRHALHQHLRGEWFHEHGWDV